MWGEKENLTSLNHEWLCNGTGKIKVCVCAHTVSTCLFYSGLNHRFSNNSEAAWRWMRSPRVSSVASLSQSSRAFDPQGGRMSPPDSSAAAAAPHVSRSSLNRVSARPLRPAGPRWLHVVFKPSGSLLKHIHSASVRILKPMRSIHGFV